MRRDAEAFVDSLGIHSGYFDRQHDRCYCLECCPAAWPDKITNQGPTPYVIPRGWVRIGLADNRLLDRTLKVFAEWSVSFHGVKSVAALRSILQERRLMTPGETLMDGIFSDNPSISPFRDRATMYDMHIPRSRYDTCGDEIERPPE